MTNKQIISKIKERIRLEASLVDGIESEKSAEDYKKYLDETVGWCYGFDSMCNILRISTPECVWNFLDDLHKRRNKIQEGKFDNVL